MGHAAGECYFEALFTFFDDLTGNPQMGRQRDEVIPGIRSFSQGRQIVFYEAEDSESSCLWVFGSSRRLLFFDDSDLPYSGDLESPRKLAEVIVCDLRVVF